MEGINNAVMDHAQMFNNHLASYGLNQEFGLVLNDASYDGPVIFFDLTSVHLEKLGINKDKAEVLSRAFAKFVCVYEQMNAFILMDEANKSLFFSTREICNLLAGKSGYNEFLWMAIFPGIEPRKIIPQRIDASCRDDTFSCMHLREIPPYYEKYGQKIYDIRGYFPELMFFIMENVAKGIHPHVFYPLMYKNEGMLSFPPKTVLWHRVMR